MIETMFRTVSPVHGSFSNEEFAQGCMLLRACGDGDLEKVQETLEQSPSLLNFADYDRRTALHVAASDGHLALVELLLKKGANPNRSDRWGGSPLDDSQRHRYPQVAAVLREHGGRGGVQDHGQALIFAASKGDAAEVRALISDGANPDYGDYDRRTAMHLAACEGHTEVLQVLIELGANVNVVDRWECTPIDEAMRKSHIACVRALELAGATPTADPEEESSGKRPPASHRANRANAHAAAADKSVLGASFSKKTPSSMMVDWADVQVLEKIGSGAFGDIFKCRWRGTLVAAKTIKSGESLHAGGNFGPGGSLSLSATSSARLEAVEDFKHEVRARTSNVSLHLSEWRIPLFAAHGTYVALLSSGSPSPITRRSTSFCSCAIQTSACCSAIRSLRSMK